jgi:hypothetical protein
MLTVSLILEALKKRKKPAFCDVFGNLKNFRDFQTLGLAVFFFC